MPQSAQQDYIRIEIADITALTDAEKAQIAAKVANGTIFDCIIVNGGVEGRVIGCDATGDLVYFFDTTSEQINSLDYSE